MANQAIALQVRAPSASSGGNVFAQNMQMMNMMAQRTAAERQAATAQQSSEFAQAEEGRKKELQPAALAKGRAEATAEEIKTAQLFNNAVYTAAANSNSPEDFTAFAQRIAAAPQFQNQLYFGGLNTVLKSMPTDPAEFPEWKRQTGIKTIAADKRYEEKLQSQKTGTEERIISIPAYGGAATEVPGSRIQSAQDITYVRGEDGSVRAMPKDMPGTGGFGAPAPAAPAAGLVGGARGGGLGPSIEQVAQQLSPGVVVSGRARTPARNAQVGGVPDSYHLTDNARDLQPGKGQTLAGLYKSLAPLKAQGFDVIKERNHVHVEPSPGKAPAPRGGAGGLQFGQVVPGMEGGRAKAKDLTVSEQTASYNIKRLLRGADAIKKAVGRTPGANVPSATEAAVGSLPFISKAVNFTRGEDRQIVAAAQRDVLDALLYLATGAAYNKEQLEGQMESYIPAYSDEPGAIESKRERLAQLVTDAKTRAGRGWTPELDKAASTLFSSQTPVAAAKPAATPTAPKIGAVAEGHRFKGGDPANPKNWEKVR
jgi:hypothetical protein